MFCVNCGKDIPENSYICPYCKFVLNKDYEQTYNSSGKKQESIPIKSVIKFIAEALVVIICVAGGFNACSRTGRSECCGWKQAENCHNQQEC